MTDTREKTTDKPKLSVIKPGHWRNRYLALHNLILTSDDGFVEQVRKDQEFLGCRLWPSREIAEERAKECSRDPEYASGAGDARYLGAQFFPADNPPA